MKISKLEQITLIITILALLIMVSYFLAVNLSARPVTFVADDPNADPLFTQTSSDLPDPFAPPFPININEASEAELILLPGIGKTRAAAIVAYREEYGPFLYPEQLTEVEGIGEKTLADILDYITTD